MKIILALSLVLLLVGCEITVQDPTMIEISGGSKTFQEKVDLVDSIIANIKSNDLKSTIISNAKVDDLKLIRKFDFVKIIQNNSVFLKCDIEADPEVENKLETICSYMVIEEMIAAVKNT